MSDNYEQDFQDVVDQLATLAPSALETPKPAAQVLAEVRQARRPKRPFFTTLLNHLFAPARRTAVLLTSLILLLLASLTIPAVRVAASDFLGLFRVQKFAAISVSPEQIAILQQMAEDGLTPGKLEMLQEPGEPIALGSLAEAARATGLTPRTLTGLAMPNEVYLSDGANGRLNIDLNGARAILQATGSDPLLLPDALDGQAIAIEAFPALAQTWPEDNLMLLQTESPNISYPDGLDATLIGQAILRALGLSEAEASRLAQEIDWTGTLLLPIPQDVATFSEVTVDGVSGIAVSSLSGEGNAVIWQKAGIVYLLGGDKTAVDLLELAQTIR